MNPLEALRIQRVAPLIVRAWLVGIAVTLLSCGAWSSCEAQSSRLPSKSNEARKELLALNDLVGFDLQLGTFGHEYSEVMKDRLLAALESEHAEVVAHSLNLLAAVINELAVPQEDLEEIALKLARLISTLAGSETDRALLQAAERVSWQLKLAQLSERHQRIDFLEEYIRPKGGADYYYSFEAMDELARMGGEEAKSRLEELIAESERRSVPKDLIEKAKISIEKIRLSKLDCASKVEELEQRKESLRREATQVDRQLLVWLIQKTGECEVESATELLEHIAETETYNYDYRYAAQRTLIRQGKWEDGDLLGYQ